VIRLTAREAATRSLTVGPGARDDDVSETHRGKLPRACLHGPVAAPGELSADEPSALGMREEGAAILGP